MSRGQAAFTLQELLIVLAVVGILLALGVPNYLRWRASVSVMQGAQQLAHELGRQRGEVRRLGERRAVSVAAGAHPSFRAGDPSFWRIYDLPAGVEVVSATTKTLYFVPPYGTTDASAETFVVRWSRDASLRRTVRVTSVLGKVVLK
ncbi:pilus assembly FimT family protein [Deinococcus peraridilitoris]|uniref:Prepilin-type N-terminal cleavage/methylation domain-containing protein n=1 Tax=Deinococcus peraridilitoris (strain DSM 19664 / LMG 22246 / CIP 109416 / KR-200) TaxID=937777 RepID=L0A204_DEIPD|nr:prepilin-type N-terminal cleavage/methylation domain-containing protein [Deinococcus peraridilitoris]AFZ67479.1 prepilin-type N-terminal cleavage/methylation domain-containing protein [Deinococcus peraridilitoris DSM 19664]